MKEDFERDQQHGYYKNWRKSYYQFNEQSRVRKAPTHLGEVYESNYYYETTFIRKPITPLLITDNMIPSLLAISFEQSHILVNSKTFYIKDIHDVADTPFNTIVFQLGAPPLKTKEDSRTIMNRYFDKKPLNYQFIQSIGKSLGYHHRCPFVSGYELFVPEKGSSNDSTSWYGLHHIVDSEEDKKGNHMHVYFREGHELELLVSARSFNEQVERSANLSFLQHLVIDELVGLLHYTRTPYFTEELNIVQRRLKASTFTAVPQPLEKVLHFMSSYQVSDILETVFGAGNPYIDEIRKDFTFTLKNKPSSFNK
ncbi:competence protein ComK [Carnobacterium pleistocenium]|uniref:competence protein ComK n=1 Tax=Carnobacterium pleistocenium TaxID=181073 RepID=UPI000558245C|nr:competence protein ComK [Carnobacterium pleistocenium]